MSSIVFELPAEIVAIREAIEAFAPKPNPGQSEKPAKSSVKDLTSPRTAAISIATAWRRNGDELHSSCLSAETQCIHQDKYPYACVHSHELHLEAGLSGDFIGNQALLFSGSPQCFLDML